MDELKNLFASGDVPAMVRMAAVNCSAQKMLFDKGNEKALEAFVIYGHKFMKQLVENFVEKAPVELVKVYISIHTLTEKAKAKLVARKDDELTKALIDSGQWSPFPFSNGRFSTGVDVDIEYEEISEDDE